MRSECGSFDVEELPLFLNAVLKKAQFICRKENQDLSALETHVAVVDGALSLLGELILQEFAPVEQQFSAIVVGLKDNNVLSCFISEKICPKTSDNEMTCFKSFASILPLLSCRLSSLSKLRAPSTTTT